MRRFGFFLLCFLVARERIAVAAAPAPLASPVPSQYARSMALAVSADGAFLARVVEGRDPQLEVYEAQTGLRLGRAPLPGYVRTLELIPGASPKALLFGEDRVLFDLRTQQTRVVERGQVFGFQKAKASFDGKGVLVCFQPHTFLRGAGGPSGVAAESAGWLEVGAGDVAPLSKDWRAACRTAVSPDARWLAEPVEGLRVWSVAAGTPQALPEAAGCTVDAVSFSHDGRVLFAAARCADGAALLSWEPGSWRALASLPLPTKEGRVALVSHDGAWALYQLERGAVEVVETASRKVAYRFQRVEDRGDVVLLPGEGVSLGMEVGARAVLVHSLAERRALWFLDGRREAGPVAVLRD